MEIQGNPDLHFWITRGIARRLGVNLSANLQEGVLTRADLAGMVDRCRQCDGVAGCLAYLSENPDRAPAPPDWCRNAALLAELRALN